MKRRVLPFCLLVCLPLLAQVAPIPTATDLPGSPFFIKKTWYIGGPGNWDDLTVDASAGLLYIAHAQNVQVVDINSGSVVAEIPNFREARAIALDDTGDYGYVSDGPAGDIVVFDRHTFEIQSTIPIYCYPRSVAFEPRNRLVFAICGAGGAAASASPAQNQSTGTHTSRPSQNPAQTNLSGTSHIVVIDATTENVLADIDIAGDFRSATSDGAGQVWVTVGSVTQTRLVDRTPIDDSFPPRIARLDASAIAAAAQRAQEKQSSQASPAQPLQIDWSHEANPASLIRFLRLSSACEDPQGLAVDGKDQRLFVACEDQQFVVVNAMNGALVASLVTGPGDDVIGYDADRGLIFVANGTGYGSLTIIRQDQTTDSFAVVQNLPTQERARTLAVDPSSGDVYLVTDFQGADLTKPRGIGTLKMVQVPGSFQVLVVGH
jgi:DNA-binding beta-propeller fold protein YncE